MFSNIEPPVKKHKKHKKEKDREKYDGDKTPTLAGSPGPGRLKLILNLKVGGSSTPEHSDSPTPLSLNTSMPCDGEESQHSNLSLSYSLIKKKKKEKKKKKDKKHKHHKEKRRKEREEFEYVPAYEVEQPIETGALKYIDMSEKKLFTAAEVVDFKLDDGNSALTAVGSSREARLCVIKQRNEKLPLHKLLDHLYRTLEKKDPQNFFTWPVTDKIAPGYSQIIKNPMDFNTMKGKLDDGEYYTLMEFAEDFKLMCNNAMTYNQPETVYFKAAKKLLQTGLKILTPEKIRPLLAVIPSIQNLSEESLGFTLVPEPLPQEAGVSEVNPAEEETLEYATLDPMKSEHYMPPHSFDPPDISGGFTDEYTPQEILQQARMAARETSHKLALKKPSSKMGFLRQRSDGTTSLSILTPYHGITPGTQERPMSLGTFSGKIVQGATQIHPLKDAGRQPHRTLKPLSYGCFSSYAPQRDTTFASLTDEETELLRSTYGDESSVQYSESMMEFAKGCDYAIQMVDEILNTLTRGEHSKTINGVEERKKIQEEEAQTKKAIEELESEWQLVNNMNFTEGVHPVVAKQESGTPVLPEEVDLEAVKSLTDLGIDTSFVDQLEHQSRKGIAGKLQENAELLSDLEKHQMERLKQATIALPPYCHPISREEVTLADKVVENLLTLAKEVSPANLVSTDHLRKIMGIGPRVEVESLSTAVSLPSATVIPTVFRASTLASNRTFVQTASIGTPISTSAGVVLTSTFTESRPAPCPIHGYLSSTGTHSDTPPTILNTSLTTSVGQTNQNNAFSNAVTGFNGVLSAHASSVLTTPSEFKISQTAQSSVAVEGSALVSTSATLAAPLQSSASVVQGVPAASSTYTSMGVPSTVMQSANPSVTAAPNYSLAKALVSFIPSTPSGLGSPSISSPVLALSSSSQLSTTLAPTTLSLPPSQAVPSQTPVSTTVAALPVALLSASLATSTASAPPVIPNPTPISAVLAAPSASSDMSSLISQHSISPVLATTVPASTLMSQTVLPTYSAVSTAMAAPSLTPVETTAAFATAASVTSVSSLPSSETPTSVATGTTFTSTLLAVNTESSSATPTAVLAFPPNEKLN